MGGWEGSRDNAFPPFPPGPTPPSPLLRAEEGGEPADSDEEGERQREQSSGRGADFTLPVTAFEIPSRFHPDLDEAPPLVLEAFVEGVGVASQYPFEPPVIAFVGGGLPAAGVKFVTAMV